MIFARLLRRFSKVGFLGFLAGSFLNVFILFSLLWMVIFWFCFVSLYFGLFRFFFPPQVALSKGRTSIRFRSIEHLVLSFEAGDEVTIYSKEAGMNKDLWGAEVSCCFYSCCQIDAFCFTGDGKVNCCLFLKFV